MNKISLSEMIETGAWFRCTMQNDDEETLNFQLRILSFDKLTPSDLGESALKKYIHNEGVLWILRIEVINLCKKAIRSSEIRNHLMLIDEDEYEYESYLEESYLNYDEVSGLYRFSGNTDLRPKIKVKGSVAFQLPEEENKYYLTIIDGSIEEA